MGLSLIRRGEIEVTAGNLADARTLRLGLVDDFDSEIAPELAQLLAQAMPRCIFRHITRPSHEILGLISRQDLDVAVASRPQSDMPGLIEYPLLRDPYVIALPASSDAPVEDHVSGKSGLPFLRYPPSQMIGRQIETQLRRLKMTYDNRYELESNQMLLAMVAGGAGWAITTAASYMRVKRLHGQISLHPFPGKSFARSLSLFTAEFYAQPVAQMIHTVFQGLIRQRFVEPAVAESPWLTEAFLVLGSRNMDRP